ncbi:MAG: NAD-dependent epimerase/dehydratase family protein [Acidobacteriaceae bacterium]|nr:NAD-dependent epimerase/dehydratase family protein [Acidobacteriaceae bacterium]
MLVVGGAGFIGSNLVRSVLNECPRQLTIVDNFLSADRSNVADDPAIRLIEGSIADDHVLGQLGDDLDYVFHLACYHGNQSSIHDPLADHDNNLITSLRLFERLKHMASLKKVVYAAAGCAVAEKTFDGARATTEDAPVSLFHDSPYSISKIVGEMYGNYYFARYGLPLVKARFQNVYGPGEILGAGRWRGTMHTVWRNVTPTFIWKALHQEALPIENGGIATRDFIFVEDMVRGLQACALRGAPGEVYNLGSGRETSIRQWAELINAEAGNPTPPTVTPARNWDRSGQRFASTEKAYQKLRFRAEIDVEEGIRRTVEWTKTHRADILRCMMLHAHSLPEVRAYEAQTGLR